MKIETSYSEDKEANPSSGTWLGIILAGAAGYGLYRYLSQEESTSSNSGSLEEGSSGKPSEETPVDIGPRLGVVWQEVPPEGGYSITLGYGEALNFQPNQIREVKIDYNDAAGKTVRRLVVQVTYLDGPDGSGYGGDVRENGEVIVGPFSSEFPQTEPLRVELPTAEGQNPQFLVFEMTPPESDED